MQYVVGLLLVVIVALGAYGWWQTQQISVLKQEVINVTVERDVARESVQTLEQTIAFQATQVAEAEKKMAVLSEEAARARAQVAYTRNLFADHDFQDLMEKKPGLITKRMQNATDKVFSDLNALTQ